MTAETSRQQSVLLLARASAAIRARRQSLGLKQSEVAKAARVSLRQYVTIEQGGNCTLATLERIAVALDCAPASLLSPPQS